MSGFPEQTLRTAMWPMNKDKDEISNFLHDKFGHSRKDSNSMASVVVKWLMAIVEFAKSIAAIRKEERKRRHERGDFSGEPGFDR